MAKEESDSEQSSSDNSGSDSDPESSGQENDISEDKGPRDKRKTASKRRDNIPSEKELQQLYSRHGSETFTRQKLKSVAHRKLRAKLDRSTKENRQIVQETAAINSILNVEEAGFLQPEGPLEKTVQASQEFLKASVDVQTARRASFRLDLSSTLLGPYKAKYAPNSNHVLLLGHRGHVSLMDWKQAKLGSEMYLNETIRDGVFLHSENYFALAQRKYVYIYDNSGAELHCLRKHLNPTHLAFLPRHFLLASIAENGKISYTDTSSGEIVAELRTKCGTANDFTRNPYNACIHVAHGNGTVSIWSPSVGESLAKVLCHKGAVHSVSVYPDGIHMATSGADSMVKIWDLRTWREVMSFQHFRPITSSSISQQGLLATGAGPHVEIWKLFGSGASSKVPYLRHLFGGSIVENVDFCPFEDFLNAGHAKGVDTLLIPGAGEPVWDSRNPNPFETKRQRREREVHSLLDKLGPETIALDPNFVGAIEENPNARLAEIRAVAADANKKKIEKSLQKNRSRGKNKIAKKLRRKQKNVIDEKRQQLKEQLEAKKLEQQQRAAGTAERQPAEEIGAIARFYRKSK